MGDDPSDDGCRRETPRASNVPSGEPRQIDWVRSTASLRVFLARDAALFEVQKKMMADLSMRLPQEPPLPVTTAAKGPEKQAVIDVSVSMVERVIPRVKTLFSSIGQEGEKDEQEKREAKLAENRLLTDLPREMLLNIMFFLHPEELFLLQRTSRVFRLSAGERFGLHAAGLNPDRVTGYLQRDHFCGGCLYARAGGLVQGWRNTLLSARLHCSGCNAKHPRLLFSSAQRERTAEERVCIGREGRIRFCPHRSITWKDIERLDWAARPGARHVMTCGECLGAPEKGLTALSATYTKRGCNNRRDTDIRGISSFRLEITTTIGLFKVGADEEVNLERLRLLWRTAPNRDLVRTLCCPHVLEDECTLLSPFGISHCCCVSPPPPDKEAPATSTHAASAACERVFCCAHELIVFPSSHRRQWRGRFLEGGELTHNPRCRVCGGQYGWDRDGEESWVTLEYRRDAAVAGGPACWEWAKLLDRESLTVVGDDEARHVAWCPDERCAARAGWAKHGRLLSEALGYRAGDVELRF